MNDLSERMLAADYWNRMRRMRDEYALAAAHLDQMAAVLRYQAMDAREISTAADVLQGREAEITQVAQD